MRVGGMDHEGGGEAVKEKHYFDIAEIKLDDSQLCFRIKGSNVWRHVWLSQDHWRAINQQQAAEGWLM